MRGAARNAVLLLGGEAASRVFGFLTTALLARRLGVDGFGQIGFAAAIFAYGVAATDLGLLATATRQVARDRGSVNRLAADIIPLRLVLGLIAAVLIVVTALVLPKPATVRWLLGLYALGVVAQSAIVEWVFIGSEQMGFVALARILTNASYFGLVLFAVRTQGNALLVPVAFTSATMAGAAALLFSHFRRFGQPRLRIIPAAWKQLILTAWPIGLASALTQVHVNLGLIGLGLVSTYFETGTFSSAYRLVFFMMTLDRVFYTVFFPVVSRFIVTQRERLPELTGTAIRLILAVALPLCTGMLLLAEPVVQLVFGVEYASAAVVLRIMAWFLLLSMFNSLVGYTLVGAGMERRFLRGNAIGVAASVVLSVAGITLLGGRGAAIAIVCGEAAILCALLPDFLRLVRPKLGLNVLAPVAAGGVMAGAVVLASRYGLPAAVAGGALSYTVVLALTKGITRADLGLAQQR